MKRRTALSRLRADAKAVGKWMDDDAEASDTYHLAGSLIPRLKNAPRFRSWSEARLKAAVEEEADSSPYRRRNPSAPAEMAADDDSTMNLMLGGAALVLVIFAYVKIKNTNSILT